MYREMYGWRARIGLILPGIVDWIAIDMHRYLPEGITPVILPLFPPIQRVGKEHLERSYELIGSIAKMLADEDSDYIIAAGAPIFAWEGPESDKRLIEKIKELTGLPATTTLTADITAFERLGVKKLAIASPMSKEVEERLKYVLERAGYKITVAKSLGIERNVEFANLGKRLSYQLGKEVLQQASDADALYLPCGRWPVVDNIELLENDFGKPVIASTISMWAQPLTELGIKDRKPGFGKLMNMI